MFEKNIDLNEALLTEAFDSAEGYSVVNMKPNSGSPQIFMIQNDSEENLIVRMMALSGDGDKLRTIKPTDKNVIVELMSINDKGRHIVLQNGIGSNPMKTIVTIFDTVYNNLNLQTVQTIMFRFQTKKMKGQANAVMRIMARLAVTRGKNRFLVLKEMANYTGKFSYVVMYNKRTQIEKIPGAKNIDDKFEKIETKVGEVFVDKKTGKQTSKADVVADAVATTLNKISEKEMVIKTKISRVQLMNAQYGANYVYDAGSKGLDQYEEVISKQVAVVPGEETTYDPVISNMDKNFRSSQREEEDLYNTLFDLGNLDSFSGYDRTILSSGNNSIEIRNYLRNLNSIIYSVKPSSIQKTIEDVVKLAKESLPEIDNRNGVIQGSVNKAVKYIQRNIIRSMENEKPKSLTVAQENAISSYCSDGYRQINNYLIGDEKGSAETLRHIENLDSVFIEHGTRLEKGITLYRGMKVSSRTFDKINTTKMFYFKNFVSTTVAPMIFDGSGFAQVSNQIIEPSASQPVEDTMKQLYQSGLLVSMGMIISGANKIKTITPGSISKYPRECEVILPRGLILKFNDLVKSNKYGDEDTVLAYTDVVNPESLTESDEVYDGDIFMESGELVAVDSLSFGNFKMKSELQDLKDSVEVKEILADLFAHSFNSLPDKFK